MHMRMIFLAKGWVVVSGLLIAMTALADAVVPASQPRPVSTGTNAPTATVVIELDVPVVEPIPPLEHGLSKTGRQHNSNCRYWKTVVAPVDPAKAPIRCKFCGG